MGGGSINISDAVGSGISQQATESDWLTFYLGLQPIQKFGLAWILSGVFAALVYILILFLRRCGEPKGSKGHSLHLLCLTLISLLMISVICTVTCAVFESSSMLLQNGVIPGSAGPDSPTVNDIAAVIAAVMAAVLVGLALHLQRREINEQKDSLDRQIDELKKANAQQHSDAVKLQAEIKKQNEVAETQNLVAKNQMFVGMANNSRQHTEGLRKQILLNLGETNLDQAYDSAQLKKLFEDRQDIIHEAIATEVEHLIARLDGWQRYEAWVFEEVEKLMDDLNKNSGTSSQPEDTEPTNSNP